MSRRAAARDDQEERAGREQRLSIHGYLTQIGERTG
jgi:hypothetical protein